MRTLAVFATCCLALGCGRKYTITGKVTCGGEPIEWQTDERDLLILFGPTDRKANPNVYRAESDPDTGRFTVGAIPAGEYVVAVHIFDPAPKTDQLNLKYDLAKSPLRYEVAKDGEMDIQLPKIPSRAPRKEKPKDPEDKK